MAPDTDLFRDIGFVVLGIMIFLLIKNSFLSMIAYILIAFGVVHMLFRINLDKTTERKR